MPLLGTLPRTPERIHTKKVRRSGLTKEQLRAAVPKQAQPRRCIEARRRRLEQAATQAALASNVITNKPVVSPDVELQQRDRDEPQRDGAPNVHPELEAEAHRTRKQLQEREDAAANNNKPPETPKVSTQSRSGPDSHMYTNFDSDIVRSKTPVLRTYGKRRAVRLPPRPDMYSLPDDEPRANFEPRPDKPREDSPGHGRRSVREVDEELQDERVLQVYQDGGSQGSENQSLEHRILQARKATMLYSTSAAPVARDSKSRNPLVNEDGKEIEKGSDHGCGPGEKLDDIDLELLNLGASGGQYANRPRSASPADNLENGREAAVQYPVGDEENGSDRDTDHRSRNKRRKKIINPEVESRHAALEQLKHSRASKRKSKSVGNAKGEKQVKGQKKAPRRLPEIGKELFFVPERLDESDLENLAEPLPAELSDDSISQVDGEQAADGGYIHKTGIPIKVKPKKAPPKKRKSKSLEMVDEVGRWVPKRLAMLPERSEGDLMSHCDGFQGKESEPIGRLMPLKKQSTLRERGQKLATYFPPLTLIAEPAFLDSRPLEHSNRMAANKTQSAKQGQSTAGSSSQSASIQLEQSDTEARLPRTSLQLELPIKAKDGAETPNYNLAPPIPKVMTQSQDIASHRSMARSSPCKEKVNRSQQPRPRVKQNSLALTCTSSTVGLNLPASEAMKLSQQRDLMLEKKCISKGPNRQRLDIQLSQELSTVLIKPKRGFYPHSGMDGDDKNSDSGVEDSESAQISGDDGECSEEEENDTNIASDQEKDRGMVSQGHHLRGVRISSQGQPAVDYKNMGLEEQEDEDDEASKSSKDGEGPNPIVGSNVIAPELESEDENENDGDSELSEDSEERDHNVKIDTNTPKIEREEVNDQESELLEDGEECNDNVAIEGIASELEREEENDEAKDEVDVENADDMAMNAGRPKMSPAEEENLLEQDMISRDEVTSLPPTESPAADSGPAPASSAQLWECFNAGAVYHSSRKLQQSHHESIEDDEPVYGRDHQMESIPLDHPDCSWRPRNPQTSGMPMEVDDDIVDSPSPIATRTRVSSLHKQALQRRHSSRASTLPLTLVRHRATTPFNRVSEAQSQESQMTDILGDMALEDSQESEMLRYSQRQDSLGSVILGSSNRILSRSQSRSPLLLHNDRYPRTMSELHIAGRNLATMEPGIVQDDSSEPEIPESQDAYEPGPSYFSQAIHKLNMPTMPRSPLSRTASTPARVYQVRTSLGNVPNLTPEDMTLSHQVNHTLGSIFPTKRTPRMTSLLDPRPSGQKSLKQLTRQASHGMGTLTPTANVCRKRMVSLSSQIPRLLLLGGPPPFIAQAGRKK